MKYAIISDIHGNLEALEQAVNCIHRGKPDKIICLGDLVGYGANPNECVDIVRELTNHVIVGNHDYAVIGKLNLNYFNAFARASAMWTKKLLTKKNYKYLTELPLTIEDNECFFVHGSPSEPEEWRYIISEYDTISEYQYFNQKLCFVGHSHIPGIYSNTRGSLNSPAPLENDEKYIVNVGSVGQPRDGDMRLTYVYYDNQTNTIDIVRENYDVKMAAQKIFDTGLPETLGYRLFQGR